MDGQIHPPAGFGKEQYNPPTHIIHHCCVCLSVRDVGYEEITYQLNEMRTGSPADELVLHREPQDHRREAGTREEGSASLLVQSRAGCYPEDSMSRRREKQPMTADNIIADIGGDDEAAMRWLRHIVSKNHDLGMCCMTA